MPVTGTTPDSLGSTMESTNWTANHTLMRTWLNGGIGTADLGAGVVLRDHIVRPRVLGFPVHAMQGRLQMHGGYSEFDQGAAAGTDTGNREAIRWSGKRERETIFPAACVQDDDAPWRTRWGASLELKQNATITFHISGNVRTVGAGSVNYPADELFGPEQNNTKLGRLAVCYRSGSDTTASTDPIEAPASRFTVYPETVDRFDCFWSADFTRGFRVDFFLGYLRGSQTGDVAHTQLDLRAVQWQWEVHYDRS